MQPIIGITSGVVVNKDFPNSPAVVGQQHTYISAIVRAGGVPLILPIVTDEAVLQRLYDLCDGILFAGGNDIHPSMYGAEVSELIGETDIARDRHELQLWERAYSDGKPVLGVCRGMQLMNVGTGGTLYQDIPTELPHAEVHRVDPDKSKPDDYEQIMHRLKIEPSSKLARILGVESGVGTNAFHHQAVNEIGNGFKPTAWTADGVIEAMEIPASKFVVAVQSHPESLEEKIEPIWRKLFSAFIESARPS